MTVKTKLTLGIGLLFGLISFLIIVSSLNISALKGDSENILTDNYKSLQYCHSMLSALDQPSGEAKGKLQQQMALQLDNISEPGEKVASQKLADAIAVFTANPAGEAQKPVIRKLVHGILSMNMRAIERKSRIARTTAEKAIVWVAISGTLCFLIAFTLLLNLPAYIANPIKKLTESIRQIAARNYSERIRLESGGEFESLARSFNTMAEKLEEYNNSNLAKLMMEKKRIETLIDNMHDPVIGLDEQLNVIFANEEALNISGLKKEQIVGKSAREISVTNDLIRSLIRDLPESSAEKKPNQPSVKIYAGGKESYFEKETFHIRVTPIGEEVEQLVGHVIFLRNITSYKELDSAKTNFIATVSHEVKTPIASIRMSLQLLENERIGNLNDEQKELLKSISDDTARLLRITGELLNMTQVESGKMQLLTGPTPVNELIDYALMATKAAADAKSIRLSVDLPSLISEVLADKEKTSWVITNLLSNAIRYSHEYSDIHIRVRRTTNFVEISIGDSGQGIAPEYQEKIFHRYFRVPGSVKEGTGLGLAISKEFMEAQGGAIFMQSELGKGSVFTIRLKIASLLD